MTNYQVEEHTGKLLPCEGAPGCGLCWLSPEEFLALEGDHPYRQPLSRSLGAIRYCKLDVFKDCLQGTLKIPAKGAQHTGALTFGFYIHGGRLLLVGGEAARAKLPAQLPRSLPAHASPTLLFLALLEAFMEDDLLYLQEIEGRLAGIEDKLLERMSQPLYRAILSERKRLSAFHAYYEQMVDLGDEMQAYLTGLQAAEECAAWQFYTRRTERLHNHVETLREDLLQIRELYQSQLDVQQNKVMTFLTVVTTLFLPLTLIAGWYGMNFPTMAAFHWKYGYLAVVCVSVLIIVAELIYFKKKKML